MAQCSCDLFRKCWSDGRTPYENLAVSGRATLAMAQKYCEIIGCRDMTDMAFSRLDDTKVEQNLTN
jgi:hypothetical protein